MLPENELNLTAPESAGVAPQLNDVSKTLDIIKAAREVIPFVPGSRYVTQEESAPGFNYEVVKQGPFGLPTYSASGVRMPSNLMNKKSADVRDYYKDIFTVAGKEEKQTPYIFGMPQFTGIRNPKLQQQAFDSTFNGLRAVTEKVINQVGNDNQKVTSALSGLPEYQGWINFANSVNSVIPAAQKYIDDYEQKAKTPGFFQSQAAKDKIKHFYSDNIELKNMNDLLKLSKDMFDLELIDNKDKYVSEFAKNIGNKVIGTETDRSSAGYTILFTEKALNGQYFDKEEILDKKGEPTGRYALTPNSAFTKMAEDQFDYLVDNGAKFSENYNKSDFVNDAFAALDFDYTQGIQKAKDWKYEGGGSGRGKDEVVITELAIRSGEEDPNLSFTGQNGVVRPYASTRMNTNGIKAKFNAPINAIKAGNYTAGNPMEMVSVVGQDLAINEIIQFDQNPNKQAAMFSYPETGAYKFNGGEVYAKVTGKVTERYTEKGETKTREVFDTYYVPIFEVSTIMENTQMTPKARKEWERLVSQDAFARFNSSSGSAPKTITTPMSGVKMGKVNKINEKDFKEEMRSKNPDKSEEAINSAWKEYSSGKKENTTSIFEQ